MGEAVLIALLLLLGCGANPPEAGACDSLPEARLELGTGVHVFTPLETGDDLTMWPVRHDWNRLIWIGVRVDDLVEEPVENLEVSVGLYQEDVLVAGTVSGGLAPTDTEYLGLRPRIITENYQDFSGKSTQLEVEVTDGCERLVAATEEVWLWTPEHLCEEREVPVADAVAEVVGQGGDNHLLDVRLTGLPVALYGEYHLRDIVLLADGNEVLRLDEYLLPSWWMPDELVFEAVEVPLSPDAEQVEVHVLDACLRDIVATVEL